MNAKNEHWAEFLPQPCTNILYEPQDSFPFLLLFSYIAIFTVKKKTNIKKEKVKNCDIKCWCCNATKKLHYSRSKTHQWTCSRLGSSLQGSYLDRLIAHRLQFLSSWFLGLGGDNLYSSAFEAQIFIGGGNTHASSSKNLNAWITW